MFLVAIKKYNNIYKVVCLFYHMFKGTLVTYCCHCGKMTKALRLHDGNNNFEYQCLTCKNKLFEDLLKND